MTRCLTLLLWAALGPGLAGCAGTTAVGLAQMAVNGASYMATGKSVEDHAISEVADADCRLGRLLTNDPICREPVPPGGVPTLADAAPEPARSAVGGLYTDTLGISGPAPRAAAANPAWTGRYFVIASFDNAAAAAGVARRFHRLPVRVTMVRDGPAVFHRIVAGPVDTDEAAFRARLAAAGITDSWAVTLCRATLRPPPCAGGAVQAPVPFQDDPPPTLVPPPGPPVLPPVLPPAPVEPYELVETRGTAAVNSPDD